MTEQELRNNVAATMREWVGAKRGDATHLFILSVYNVVLPHPRGHEMTLSDNWCAATASAAYILNNMADWSGMECSCGEWIKIAKRMGIWVEDDTYIPKIGDAVIYAWDDGADYAKTDNKTGHDHIGIVSYLGASRFTVIEGNYGGGVNIRGVAYNGRYIRGFICPDFAAAAKAISGEEQDKGDGKVTVTLDTLKKGARGEQVKTIQRLLVSLGYGAGAADGIFGAKTEAALIKYQKDRNLAADGICGKNTWGALLGC